MHKYMFVAPYEMVKKDLLTKYNYGTHYVSKLTNSIEECEEELTRVVGKTGYTVNSYHEHEEERMNVGAPVKVHKFLVSEYIEDLCDAYDGLELYVGIYAVKI